MDQTAINRERRRLSALERLGSDRPVCKECGENDWRCLQLKPDRNNNDDTDTFIICRNCRCKQQPIAKLARSRAGSWFCIVCTEDDPRCLELHHVAGRAFADDCVIACCNCHSKLSDMQKDHSQ